MSIIVRQLLWSLTLFTGLFCLPGVKQCRAQDTRIEDTLSPDKRYVVTVEDSKSSPRAMFFAARATGANIGWVIPPEEAGASDIHVAASWNASSTSVVLLISYGTKSSNFSIFRRDATGHFVRVDLDLPNPQELYEKNGKHAKPTASENKLGRWMAPDTVVLLAGESFVQTDGSLAHLLVPFEVTIKARGTVQNVRLEEFTSEEQMNDFVKKWENRQK